ncbi:MAG: hypoxanthine phosphoribosyltransferase [Pedosphaera sp.]|nr:hypoxanthine phosphoribosyltransferase [Pedosphaera sp.]
MNQRFDDDMERMLFTPEEIDHTVHRLAGEILTQYLDKPLTIISVLTGSLLFISDLIRLLPIRLHLDFIGTSSYGDNTTSSGTITITRQLRLGVKERHVLVVDDILDTGQTLSQVVDIVRALHPADVKTCVLLDKPSRRTVDIKPDFRGFAIPDLFVVGYGLDYAEQYRNLPYIAVLKESVYRS